MPTIKNVVLQGSNNRPFLVDAYAPEGQGNIPVVVFCHGFKGFKDWGHWDMIAQAFVAAGFCFVKFNFSHNGTTVDQPLDFADLEAFGQNNYSKELADTATVLDWIATSKTLADWSIDRNNISIIGHSRGGPIALITALEQSAVQQVVTWAGVNELDYAWQKEGFDRAGWRKEGVYYIRNGRTKQEMPQYYQLYEDYMLNSSRFSIQQVLSKLRLPYLILHGDNDPAVSVAAAQYLKSNCAAAKLEILPNADHVFGGKHPYESTQLPTDSSALVNKTIDFLRTSLKNT